MKDNSFDHTIRRKLDDLRPAFRPEHWEQFEQQLDAMPGGMPAPEEQSIDEAAFHRLHRLEVPYRSSSWEHFTNRLDKEFVRPEQIMRIKAMELFMLLLLMLTLWQSLPYVQSPVLQQANELRRDPETGTPNPDIQNQKSGLRDAEIRKGTATGSPEESKQRVKTAISKNKLADSGSPAPGFLTSPFSPNVNDVKTISNARIPLPAEALAKAETSDFLRPSEAPAKAGLFPAPVRSPGESGPASDFLIGPALLATLPAETIDRYPAELAASAILASAPSRYFYFGMFGSLDYNRIVTPSDYFLGTRLNEFDRYELGYSGGFSLGFAQGRWEFQTGAIYSAKHYRPVQLLYQYGNSRDGYVTEQLKDVQLNILHLPVNFRYNFLQSDRWRVYAIAGASLQVAIQANYYIEREGASRRSVLNRYIDNGWFEGGSFTENSYLTGNLGFGVERTLTTRWSFFAQPTYQHAISFFNQGLGPTRDRISTMSVFTGIRVRIER